MLTFHPDPNLVDIFVGEANPAEARFYVRLPGGDGGNIAGTVTGPFCAYAKTLPARVPLVDQGPCPTRLAQAIVPDPCFWTPDMPFLYHVDVCVSRPGAGRGPEPHCVLFLGIRPLSVRDRHFVLDGRAWTPRGAAGDPCDEILKLPLWHDAGLAMLVVNPSYASCAEASEIGVLLIVDLPVPPEEIASKLRELSDFAAVGFVVLPSIDLSVDDLLSAARGIILVQRVAAASDKIHPWARALLCPADDLDVAAAIAAASKLPVIARRPVPNPTTIDDARRECDHLQRDLAGRVNFAGYLV